MPENTSFTAEEVAALYSQGNDVIKNCPECHSAEVMILDSDGPLRSPTGVKILKNFIGCKKCNHRWSVEEALD